MTVGEAEGGRDRPDEAEEGLHGGDGGVRRSSGGEVGEMDAFAKGGRRQ